MEYIHDSDGGSSSNHQNPKSAAKWAVSLENLLEDPEGVKRFREFLKKEFSEENVLFWLACEDFKKTQDKKKMQEKAKEIYMTYLSSKASSQVNVEGQSRLSEKILEEPHPLMFQKLQDQVIAGACCLHGCALPSRQSPPLRPPFPFFMIQSERQRVIENDRTPPHTCKNGLRQ
ncbi:regulator of G-protein signaling 10 isoform X2 [Erinaceus europaeus]|uniref:Regulator of G-protein signaling 10 isoform X2 n=1 Tax=Erinaceus europaeus TaxID=9365 RepID=A0ABM3VS77_ERIEU|nr:regulator of G-protein signaling 10 isoform X2 [Erinaceus europaeus]